MHTAATARATATTLFIDSQICKWNIEDAKRAYAGEQADPIRQKSTRTTSRSQPHLHGQTKEADAVSISLNKFSKDRYLNVGPLKPENDQLIDISGDQMVLVHDNPTSPSSMTRPSCTAQDQPGTRLNRDDPFFADAVKQAQADGIDSCPTRRSSATATRCAST